MSGLRVAVECIREDAQSGDRKAAENLLSLVRGEARRLAVLKLPDQPAGYTLRPTFETKMSRFGSAGP
jgi:hypothetical protein